MNESYIQVKNKAVRLEQRDETETFREVEVNGCIVKVYVIKSNVKI